MHVLRNYEVGYLVTTFSVNIGLIPIRKYSSFQRQDNLERDDDLDILWLKFKFS